MTKELEQIKQKMSNVKGHRTVKLWNELREELKQTYSEHIISELDSSGYIIEWLNKIY